MYNPRVRPKQVGGSGV